MLWPAPTPELRGLALPASCFSQPLMCVASFRATCVPVTLPAEAYTRPLRDLGPSTVETPDDWWSAICKQEVRGSIPRVSTQIRGPFRSSARASFVPPLRARVS